VTKYVIVKHFSLDGTPKHQFTNPEMKKALYVAVNSSQQIIIPDYHLNTLFIYDHKGNSSKECIYFLKLSI